MHWAGDAGFSNADHMESGLSSICSAYPRGWALGGSQTPPHPIPAESPSLFVRAGSGAMHERELVIRDGAGRLGPHWFPAEATWEPMAGGCEGWAAADRSSVFP